MRTIMAVICSSFCAETGCLALASSNRVITAVERNNAAECGESAVQLHHLSVNNSPVVCLSFNSSGKLLAICTDDKTLRLWDVNNGWSLKSERVLSKRATVLAFTSDDQFILVADKAGDVYQYHVTNITLPGTLLLGHLSMLLDMVLVLPSNSHVITCDRDEKIRVSNYPNTYNIETYCLGHTEFVSRLCLCKEWPHLLMSASGDGTVRCWDWKSGRLLDTVVCSRLSVGVGDDGVLEAVTGLCCTANVSPPLVVASLERSPILLVFTLSSNGKLTECPEATVKLATPPLSLAFDWSDQLWVCLLHQPEPLLCYHCHGNKLTKLQVTECPFLEKLNKWDHFKDLSTKDWEVLRKHDFDNMSSYFARKTERIKVKRETPAAATSNKTTTTTMIDTTSSSQNEHLTDSEQQTVSPSGNKVDTSELVGSTECSPEAKRIKTALSSD